MPRLINADALIKKWENVHSKDMSFAMAVIGAINDVKNAPTIDAVPIQWILKWKEKFENAYSDEYDPTVAEMLVDMLEDWREENG